jgi:hypothetical protein
LTSPDDYSFLTLTKDDTLKILLHDRFSPKISYLPPEYYETFCQLNFRGNDTDGIVRKVRFKQFILQTTGLYPVNYSDKEMVPFMQLLSLSSTRDSYLPRCVMLKVAGSLFL